MSTIDPRRNTCLRPIGLRSPACPLQFGDYPDNYTSFDENGFAIAYGDARGWIDFNFPATSLRTGGSAPDLIQINGGTIYYAGFDGSNVGGTTEQIFGQVELNHEWAEGTVLKPHLHCVTTTANAGTVRFYLTYTMTEEGVDPAETTINTNAHTVSGTAWDNFYLTFPDIVTTGHTIGTQFSFRLYRVPGDAADTYDDDVIVKTVGLHVLANSIGSRQVAVK